MTEDLMGYNQIVENALKGVVREALTRAAAVGLPGDHHFYITYRTDAPGVQVPQSLREQYPEEITIVIQHQFWDLVIDQDLFSVSLSFAGKKEHLEVPFSAITGFADPACNLDCSSRRTKRRSTKTCMTGTRICRLRSRRRTWRNYRSP